MKRTSQFTHGSSLLGVLMVTACMLGITATVFMQVHRLAASTHRDAAWVQALYAAHAGLDVATAKIGLSSTPLAFSLSGSLDMPGEDAGTSTYNTTLSLSLNNGLQALRLRSTGRTTLRSSAYLRPNVRVGSNATLDHLRPFYFGRYRGAPVTTPFAERSVEAILALGLTKWKYAFQTEDNIRVQGENSIIDSYDSSDATKSSNINGYVGQYDSTKRQQNALVATRAPFLGAIELYGRIYGNVATKGVSLFPALLNLGRQLFGGLVRLTGTISTDYNETMDLVPLPTWSPALTPSGNDLQNGDRTLTAGPTGNPTRYKFADVNRKMTLALPNGSTSGEVEVWVTGNINANNPGDITVAKGVKATIYFENGLNLNGKAIDNQNRNAAYLSLLGARQTGSSSINVNGAGDLWAIIYAPLHNMSLSGDQQLYGTFGTKSVTMNNTVGVHYDEALSRLGGGSTATLQILSYVEDLP